MRGLGTDHVMSGPMIGLEKNASYGMTHATHTQRHKDGHRDSKVGR